MRQDDESANDWIARAAEQALALRETVQAESDLLALVDLLLIEVAHRLASRVADDDS